MLSFLTGYFTQGQGYYRDIHCNWNTSFDIQYELIPHNFVGKVVFIHQSVYDIDFYSVSVSSKLFDFLQSLRFLSHTACKATNETVVRFYKNDFPFFFYAVLGIVRLIFLK